MSQCGINLLNKLDITCEQACIATSRENYYTENFKTLPDYNNRNNTPLLSENIQEEMCKVMEEESITYSNNVTVDTFSHTYNTQRENLYAVFTSEKLDKLEELTDTLKDLKINDD